jgi:hypothetical protein
VGVVVPVFQVHLMNVCMCMVGIAVHVLMLDVVVLMAGVQVSVDRPLVLMLVVVWGVVPTGCVHVSLPLLVSYFSVADRGENSGSCRWPLPDTWSMCLRASSSRDATCESNNP